VQPLDLDQQTGRQCGGQRVLLVDDEPRIRELCQKFLESRDYQVDVAGDGEEALCALTTGHYELLITDHLMPKLNGVDLVRRLRANGKDIPAILISGDMPYDEPDLRQLFNAGALLAKPFSMSQFLRAVGETLGTTRRAA